MKKVIRPAVLPAAVLTLAMASAPYAFAQSSGAGYSVHSKTTPSEPPAAAPQPTEPAAQPEAAAPPQQAPAAAEPPAAQAEGAAPPAEGEQQPGAQAAAPNESNPLGVSNGWDTKFGVSPPQTSQYTGAPEQVAIIDKINAYFNDMKNLEGDFLQTDADNSHKKGRFFIERPGKVRFDYALPSRQKIISNGKYLAIEDHDLNTADRYPLDSTPFRLLLKERVDLAEDAQIIALDAGENIVVLTVEDKESRGGGQIRLFFDWPQTQLREWIITDAQGLNTRIQLAELETNKDADPKLFTFSQEIGMPKFRGSNN